MLQHPCPHQWDHCVTCLHRSVRSLDTNVHLHNIVLSFDFILNWNIMKKYKAVHVEIRHIGIGKPAPRRIWCPLIKVLIKMSLWLRSAQSCGCYSISIQERHPRKIIEEFYILHAELLPQSLCTKYSRTPCIAKQSTIWKFMFWVWDILLSSQFGPQESL